MKDLSEVLTNDLNVVQKKVISQREAIEQYKLIVDSLMNSLVDGMLILDKNSNISDINLAFEKIFSIKEEEFLGKEVSELFEIIEKSIDKDGTETFKKIYSKVNNKESFLAEEFDASVIDESEEIKRYLKIFTSPIYNNKLGFIGRIWRFEDRTKEMKIDKMKTEFISIASHQLRTPLTTIRGNLEMILDGDFGKINKEVKMSIKDMNTASVNLIELVNSLLDISRLEMGTVVPEPEEIDLVKVIDKNLKLLENQVKKKEINLNIDMPESLIINTDEKLFCESTMNYLSNAIKYTPKGGEVDISLTQSNNEIIFSVADTGLGVPEDSRDHLFDKFFRADNVLTQNFEGTGLGLYYVKKSINVLGGEVFYKPKKDGSIFGFILPI